MVSKRLFVYILLIFTFLMIACSEEESTDLQINGYVFKASDGSPLSGALVELRIRKWETSDLLASDYTDSKGHYAISHSEEGYCPGSLLFLKASAYGYQPMYDSDSASTRLRCTNGLQTINFRLKKAE